MPYYSFYLAQDVRAYSLTRAIEAPTERMARQRVQEMLDSGQLSDETNVDWESASSVGVEMAGECEPNEHEVVDPGPSTPEPDTMTAQLLLRPAVEVVSGLALLSQREREIGNER